MPLFGVAAQSRHLCVPLPVPVAFAVASAAVVALTLVACTAVPPGPGRAAGGAAQAWQQQLDAWPEVQILLLGEQHDQPEHQAWQAATIAYLAQQQRLAAVVMEMAPAGGSTAALPSSAPEAQVQAALQWQAGTEAGGWPWLTYGPVVMAAVRAGVPVLGGNLPRPQMRVAMQNTAFDSHLPAPGWQQQLQAIRDGHCGLLPEAQVAPMARIQLARDQSLARVAQAALPESRPGERQRQVLVVAGNGHARSDIGVPTWLGRKITTKVALAHADQAQAATNMQADWWQPTVPGVSRDHCAELRARWQRSAP